jgi:hypothetical protein
MTDDRRQPPDAHERYAIPHADVLFADTWAEEKCCAHCGRELAPGASQCPTCHQWVDECGMSCPGCPSPKCVGGKRKSPAEKGRR